MKNLNVEHEGDQQLQHQKDLRSPSFLRDLWAYLEVTKPASVLLLVFTGLATMVIAGRGWTFPVTLFIKAFLAIMLGCAGANTVTCYIDRDMDRVMKRTKRRPLPSKRIFPARRALYWGVVLTAISLVLAWTINPLTFLWGLLGLVDNVVVYSLLLKRRSALNIVLGGFSGGIPVLIGWAAVTNTVSLTALLIGAVVVLWIPNHIWNLAIVYTDDYKKVRVPMLPAVLSLEKTTRCIMATVVLMYLCSLIIYFAGGFGLLYLAVAAIFGFFVTVSNVVLALKPSREKAWIMFKLSSPYLFVLFLAMALDVLIT